MLHSLLSASRALEGSVARLWAALAAASIVPAAALGAALPAPPETFDSSYVAPTGKKLNVAPGGNLQAALRNPSLRHIALAIHHQTAQTRPPDRGAVDEPTPGISVQRLEHKFVLSCRQAFHIVGAHEMRLRHVVAQDLSFCRLYLQFLVPIRQR